LTNQPCPAQNTPETSARILEIEALRETIGGLAATLAAVRLQSANRLAAIRAALGAAADGESDPLAYLRDQLAEEAETTFPDAARSGQ
jgi:hydroxymethylglutaryl-CoA reductase